MKKLHVRIEPTWHITGPTGLPVPPRVLHWLLAIQQHGNLSAACKAQGASYRHTWKLLHDAEAALGTPLVNMARGKGSVLTTAGGLLFTGKETGEFVAYDLDNGEQLWQFQTTSGINAQPITFTHKGRQYVAIQSGIGGVNVVRMGPQLANVPRGGTVTVTVSGEEFLARARGERARVPDAIAQVLAGAADLSSLDARLVQPYYARLLAASAGLGLTMAMDGDDVVVRAGGPQSAG